MFFDPVNSLVSGSMTEQQWIDGIKSASDQMRANIIELSLIHISEPTRRS